MRFGRIPIADAVDGILAHSIRIDAVSLKKGRILSDADVAQLQAAGLRDIVVARLDVDDLGENEAARRIAKIVCGPNTTTNQPFAGRCNVYADAFGLVDYDRECLDQLNLVDEAITIASLPPYEPVSPHQMLATIKIIPYGVPERAVAAIEAMEFGHQGLFKVASLTAMKVGLVQSTVPGLRESVLDKTRVTLDTRLARWGSAVLAERRCPHQEEEIASALDQLQAAGCELLLIAGASATADRRDVVPLGIERAGGRVVHLGMPVEPGNLLLLGEFDDGLPVVCLPGCARSPVFNGFDWILERLLAKVPVTREAIMSMGAGGLIKGTASPRRTTAGANSATELARVARRPKVAGVVLAAGTSSRMGDTNKLLAPVGGIPMIARVVEQVVASRARPILVVLGHESENVRACLREFDVVFVHNPDYLDGLSTSIRAGIRAVPAESEGAIVCLGDMPWVTGADIDAVLAAFDPIEGREICVASHRGQRGNPVLWSRSYFSEISQIQGDTGARDLLREHADLLCEVEVTGDSVLRDIDVPAALQQAANA